MRFRLLFAFLVILLCSAFQSTGFSGCGGSAPPPADLPPSEEMGCFTDADCITSDPCRVFSCVTGTCVDRGIRDNDGDGVGGDGCGMDCDDFDSTRYPGAAEFCDGRDQDCDTIIDEDAMPNFRSWTWTTNEPNVAMAALGDGLIIAERPTTGLAIVLNSTDRYGNPLSVMGGFEGESLLEFHLTTRTAGATLVALTAESELVMLDVDTGLEPSPPVRVPVTAATRLAITTYAADQLAAVWVENDAEVWFWSSELGSTVSLGAISDPGPLDIAFDGVQLVLAVPPAEARFINPATGEVAGTRDLGATPWAFAPLASGDGEVIAVVRDAFDHAITGLTSSSPIGRSPAPSVFDTTMPARVDTLADRIVLTRFSDGTASVSGTTISLLNPAFVATFSVDPSMVGTFGGFATGWDVALHPDFTAVITVQDGAAFGVTLDCGF